MTKPSTEKSFNALMAFSGVIQNRGHAYFILKGAGQHGSPRVFVRAIKRYEEAKGVKLPGKKDADRRASRGITMQDARGLEAQDVRDHLRKIETADELFWACWQQQIYSRDFQPFFTSYDAGEDQR